ncbi:MAG: glycine betaine ABC transporter substrate-binding protein [Gammaproteobacteria bacterium]|nr:glycine betaine ABC transporter substrate-binding protein [Gammaproteobacteria bacterium]
MFISYASQDKAVADALCAELESGVTRCWYAPRDVLPGKPYGEALADAIDASNVMVLVFSGHSNASPQVMREVERAVRNHIHIVPFRIEDIKPTKALAYFVDGLHWLDAITPPLDQHIEQLADTIRKLPPRVDRQADLSVTEPVTHRVQRLRVAVGHGNKLISNWSFAAIAVALVALVAIVFRWSNLDSTVEVDTSLKIETPAEITIGGKKFLESSLLVEMMAKVIEFDHPQVIVKRRHYDGESVDMFVALQYGKIDMYPEYSGTLLAQHLGLESDKYRTPKNHERDALNDWLKRHGYSNRLTWLSSFGIDNPFVLVMLRERADALGLIGADGEASIAGLAKQSRALRFAGTFSFSDRSDGADFLRKYNLQFKGKPAIIDHEQKYEALLNKEMDVTDGYASDPQLVLRKNQDFIALKDVLPDGQPFFPPYLAAPLVRNKVLSPQIAQSLNRLQDQIENDDMASLIAEAIDRGIDKSDLRTDREAQAALKGIVSEFLVRKGVIQSSDPAQSDPKGEPGTNGQSLVLVKPKNGQQVLGRLRYEWQPVHPSLGEVLYVIERKSGNGYRDSGVARRPAYIEDELIGEISWRVYAQKPDGSKVGEPSPWWTTHRYPDSLSRVLATGTVTVGVGKDDELFVNETEERLTGLEIELLRRYFDSLLKSHQRGPGVRLTNRPAEWGDRYFTLLREDQGVDILASRISITREREQKYNIRFTRPIIRYPQSIITRKGVDLFKDGRLVITRLGAQADTTNEELGMALLRLANSEVKVMQADDSSACADSACLVLWSGHLSDIESIKAVHYGDIDGLIADKPYAHFLVHNDAVGNLDIVDVTQDKVEGIPVQCEAIGFATREMDSQLREQLNQAIEANPAYRTEYERQVLAGMETGTNGLSSGCETTRQTSDRLSGIPESATRNME